MKVVFICGALEDGRDGVGDYTRKLAGELIRQGHPAAVVAINDRYLSEQYDGDQERGNTAVPVLRLPAAWPAKTRFSLARKWIDLFSPEWLSLQFVPYSFQKKGIPLGMHRHLGLLTGGYRWHIMFHEIWLDAPKRFSHYIVAGVQYLIVSRCLKQVKAEAVHVSMSFNQRRLKRLYQNSEVLSLFGNIEKQDCKKTLSLFKNQNHFSKNILYFGSAPRGKFLDLLVFKLLEFCQKQQSPIRIFVAAGHSEEKNNFIAALKKELFGHQVTVVDCGFVEEKTISTLMSNCTVGIARTEAHLLGKSGSAMAMLEHGIPVWLPKWSDNRPLEIDFRNQLVHADLDIATETIIRPEYSPLLPRVAASFINRLNDSL